MSTTDTKRKNPYQIELSDDVRQKLGLPLGVEIGILRRGDSVTLAPIRPLTDLICILKGAHVDFSTIRDKVDKHQ